MSITTEELNHAMDSVAWRTLERLELQEPPVVPEEVATRLAAVVVDDITQTQRGCLQNRMGTATIVVRPEDRPERFHWSVAHEIGEMFVDSVLRRADYEAEFASDQLREFIANGVGSRLLLPNPVFTSVYNGCGGDLAKLKAHFSTASHKVIAMRSLDLEERAVVTVVDNGKITRRRANFATQAMERLSPQEGLCLRMCQEDAAPSSVERGGVSVRCWPVYEDGNPIKREIMRACQSEWF